jgi:HSP20 family protein
MSTEEQKKGQQPATEGEQASQSAPARRKREHRGRGMWPYGAGQWPNPFGEMGRAFEGMLERGFPHGWMHPWRMAWPSWPEFAPSLDVRVPRLDMIDRENEVVLRAEVPGVKKEDLEVAIQDEIITIRGEVRQEAEKEKGQYRWREMSYDTFSRSVPLPAGVDADKIKVTFKNGILEVRLPRTEQAQGRRIPVEGEE